MEAQSEPERWRDDRDALLPFISSGSLRIIQHIMVSPAVTLRDETVVFPTYLPAAADPNPMFLEKRVYQGSSGRVYPLPFTDRIAEKPVPHAWRSLTLENEFLEIQILPEIGGRIHRLRDKTNNYDAIYYQPVIKPALVGLAGPWISGGIEFNWPQHHRPSTFMPAWVDIERHNDGAITVWLSEHDPMSRMKGMHGVRLRPGCAVLELDVRVYNRTSDVQTFLWWANVATEVHERYQSFFPEDVTFVADHAKRAMSAFPLSSDRYYGVDYAGRAQNGTPEAERPRQFRPDGSYPANDLSWYANIPVPTSYMCMGTRDCFFGGYDHRARAGIIHVANPHISPGKKQWTWGNHEFGYAWDRLLTDPDERGIYRPYIELMAGVYTDNQPDFSYLQPGETKTWLQFWYPIRDIGPAHAASEQVAARLDVAGCQARVGVHATQRLPSTRIRLVASGKTVASIRRDLSPADPCVAILRLPCAFARHELELVIERAERELLVFRPQPARKPPRTQELKKMAATEPPEPARIETSDELYITGLHLEQYRHATRMPENYWREALRRDPGDARCNLALGRQCLRRGEFAAAEQHFRACIARLTRRNPNPADGEAYYQLGRALRYLGRDNEAYAAFYKAAWNQAWAGASYHALAEIDSTGKDYATALAHLERSLELGSRNLRARALKAQMLLRLDRPDEAKAWIEDSLRLDPLDPWLRILAGREFRGDNGIRLDVALDLAGAGLLVEALDELRSADLRARDGSVPMILYVAAWLYDRGGNAEAARAARAAARRAAPDYCFPSRLEEMLALEAAIAADPGDARAHFYLGHLLYDRRRHREAIARWEVAAKIEPDNAIVWRCLGIARFNVLRQPAAARRAFIRARAVAPDDARLLYEADQLAKRLRQSPQQRLRTLERRPDLVAQRDDLSVEFAALLNRTGRMAEALRLLETRRFQPWEGGEGQALGQYVGSRLRLARECLAAGAPAEAVLHLQAALSPPENLGEARHLLANQSDIYLWLGDALRAAGREEEARKAWRMAAGFRGDFQQMSVRAYSEMTWFSATAMHRLGNERAALKLFRDLLGFARAMEKCQASIDYFATSLPTMLLFEEDIQERQVVTARFLQAQALLGLGTTAKARRLLEDVLARDPNHALAADFLALAMSRRYKHSPDISPRISRSAQ